MSITITDPGLIEAFRVAETGTDVTDPDGNILATLKPMLRLEPPPPGYQSDLSPEEAQRRIQQKSTVRLFKDVIRELRARG